MPIFCFGMCVKVPIGTYDVTHFWDFFLCKDFFEKSILQEPTIQLGFQLVESYIADDYAYPLMIHIVKTFVY